MFQQCPKGDEKVLLFQNDIDVLKKRRMIKYFFTKYYAFYDGFLSAEFHTVSGPRGAERLFLCPAGRALPMPLAGGKGLC